ncbi:MULTISPECIES: hypothetical protein [unclassified Streptomyces]|uniref:hypothetical protein n=1 Tax=unclassified Streptomyces TaxID=2593676 RepID=UPI001BE4F75F|nr:MULTISPECIES: hypothetical protein [unclassified Streptomyces]MBT2408524.1 hypothetical protein [Streptomyces sp. ISL-21]MBT2459691.1 hypothetical protein [Streptomyces sp. ISL-86]MBT2611961.1 hypothetical protein [Streptomyces sp. ISL-87]
MFDALRPKTVVCSYCQARPADGDARTLYCHEGRLTVTWHTDGCPHYTADRVLAGMDT